MTKTERRALVTALMVVTFLAAMDITIVTIAGPQIAEQLSGFDSISFLFSAYTLASSVTIPIYGKLADLWGRKRVLVAGVVIFLGGSLLCALAPSMGLLIAARAIQGAGVGAIFTLVNTIIGDAFELESRSTIMGLVGTVWGVASLVGPFVGGLLLDLLSWHWIFLINLPLGLLGLVLLIFSFKEDYQPRQANFDFGGAVLLALAVSALLASFNSLAPNEGAGQSEAGLPTFAGIPLAALLAVAAAALLACFVFVERRVGDPIIPRSVNTRTTVVVNVVCFVASVTMMGSSIYLPMYLQDVLGLGATVSGLAFLPQSLAWLVMSFTLGSILIRFGVRHTIIGLSALMAVAYLLYCLLGLDTPAFLAFSFIAFSGFGLGGVMNGTMIVIQESVDAKNRGAAVGMSSMLRSIGQAIGAGIYGGVFNTGLAGFFSARGITGVDLGNPYASVGAQPQVTKDLVAEAFNSSLHMVFVLLAALAAVTLATALFVPKVELRPSKTGQGDAEAGPAEARLLGGDS
jgi:EmrB/QacA subfamily drug resistance transporter